MFEWLRDLAFVEWLHERLDVMSWLRDATEAEVGDVADFIIRDVFRQGIPWVFEGIERAFTFLVEGVENLLTLPPPLLLGALAAFVAWRIRSWQFGVFVLLGLALVDYMGLWTPTMDTLAMILLATLIGVVVGIPVGIAAARNTTVSVIVRPVLDFMQTLPVLVYLIPAVLLLGTGTASGLAATLIFAIPPGVRLTELGLRNVDPEIVEAAEAFGSTRNRTLVRVQMPLALHAIMQGINQVIMLALSMVVIAGFIGAGGLGREVVQAISQLDIGGGFEAGVAVVILAIILDRLTAALGDRQQRRTGVTEGAAA